MTNSLSFLLPPILLLLLPFMPQNAQSRPEGVLGLQRRYLPLDSTEPSEQTHPSDSTDDFRNYLINDLKRKILLKLGLPSPPSSIASPFNLSRDVVELLRREEDLSELKPKENLIAHAHNNDFNCSRSNNTSCRKFDFKITSDLQSVISVHAWFHKKQPIQRLTMSVYSTITSEDGPMIKLKELKDASKMTLKSGWIMFELPKMLSFEFRNNHLQCSIETEGTDVYTQEDRSPFLVLTKYSKSPERERVRRTVEDSDRNCSCCTENHYISVKDLGWSDWVISPEGFNVKTCRGQCDENQSSFTINYQRIISTLYKINKTLQKPKCNFWAPSCQPDSYLPKRMIFRMENGTWLDQRLEDMLIGSCSCR